MPEKIEGELLVKDARIAIVVSRFNDYFTAHMEAEAVSLFQRMGGSPDNLTVVHVPGAFEIPLTAQKLGESGKYDAIVCLGCVIRGETDHYDHVCEQSIKGIKDAGLKTGVPTTLGIVTAENLEQAVNRAGGKVGNAGGKAMAAAVEMINVLKKV